MHVSVVEGPSDCWHHFHPSLNLIVNSRKRSSQFEWYDITRYDITLIKPVDQPWLNPVVWQLNLMIYVKKFWWLFCESTQFIVVPQLPHSNLFTHYSFQSILLRRDYDLAHGFPSESSKNLIKMRYLSHHEFLCSNFE